MADRPSIESLRDICMVNLCSEDEAAMNAALSELATLRAENEALRGQIRDNDDADTAMRQTLCEERDEAERQRDAERARADALAARVDSLMDFVHRQNSGYPGCSICGAEVEGDDNHAEDCGVAAILCSTPAADLEAHDARVRREALEGAWERVKLHNHNPTGYINVNVIRNAIRGEAIVECGCHLDHKARAAAILGPEAQDNEQETK